MQDAFQAVKATISLLIRYPIMLIPLLMCWASFASAVLYFKFSYTLHAQPLVWRYIVVAAFIVLLSFLIVLACSMILRMIFDIETISAKPRLWPALTQTCRNLFRLLPLTLWWALIWFVLVVLSCLFNKLKSTESREFNIQNAALTLVGRGEFSITGTFFEAMEKVVRMAVLLCLPAIIWQNYTSRQSMNRMTEVIAQHPSGFVSNYLMSYIVMAGLGIPASIVIYMHVKGGVHITDSGWLSLIFYSAILWSFEIFMEQVMMATQYIRHVKWEKAVEVATAKGSPIPQVTDIPLPSLLDDIADLAIL